MNHEEYLLRLEEWTDADAAAVLGHAGSCSECRREARRAERVLLAWAPPRRSALEEVARWAAVAAFLAIAVSGLRSNEAPKPSGPSRYRVVGDASGVVAYTPGGVVVGTAARPPMKEIQP